nr:hypothetical protein I308_03630 [Cryptococcus tetragattii IND107]
MRHRRQRYAPPSLALVLVVLILVIVAEVGEALEHGRGGTGVERRVHNQTRRRAIGGKKRQFNLISELESLDSSVSSNLFDLLAPTTSTEHLVSSVESTSFVQSSTQPVATSVVEHATNAVQSIATSASSAEKSSTIGALAPSTVESHSATLLSSSDQLRPASQSTTDVKSTSSVGYVIASYQGTSTSHSSEATSSYSPVASSNSATASPISSLENIFETFSPASSVASILTSSAIELSTKTSTSILMSQLSSASSSQAILVTSEAIVESTTTHWGPASTVIWATKSKSKRRYREMRGQASGQMEERDDNRGEVAERDIQTEVEDFENTATNTVGDVSVTADQDWGITSAAVSTSAAAAMVTSALVEVTSVSVGQQITSNAAEPTTAAIMVTSPQMDTRPIVSIQASTQTSTLDGGVWSSSPDAVVTLSAPSSFTADSSAFLVTSATEWDADTSVSVTAAGSQPGQTLLSNSGLVTSAAVDDSGLTSLSFEVLSISAFGPLVSTQSGEGISGVMETASITTLAVETNAWTSPESLTVTERVNSDVTNTQLASESSSSAMVLSDVNHPPLQTLSDLSSMSIGETSFAPTASIKLSSSILSNTLPNVAFSASDTMSYTSIEFGVSSAYNTFLSSQSEFSTSSAVGAASSTVSAVTKTDGLSESTAIPSLSSELPPTTVLSSVGDLSSSATLPPTASVITNDSVPMSTTVTGSGSPPATSLETSTRSNWLSEPSITLAESYSLLWSSAIGTESNEVLVSSAIVFATESNGLIGSSWVEGANITTTMRRISSSDSMTTETGSLSALSVIFLSFSSTFERSTADASDEDILSSLTQYRQFVTSSTSFSISVTSLLPSSLTSVDLSSLKTSVVQKTDIQGSSLGSESEVLTTATQTAAVYVSESGSSSPSASDVPITSGVMSSEAVASGEVVSFDSAVGGAATTSFAASSFSNVEIPSVTSSLGEAITSSLDISASTSEAAISTAASSSAPSEPLSTSVSEPTSATSEMLGSVPSSSEILPVSDGASSSNVFSTSSLFAPFAMESSSYVEPSDTSFTSGAPVGATSSPEPSSSVSAVVEDTTSQVASESIASMPAPTESFWTSSQTFSQITVPTTVSAVAYAGPSSSVIESSNVLSNSPEASLSSSQSADYDGIISQAVSSSFGAEKSMRPSSSAQMSVTYSAPGSINQAATSAVDYSLTDVASVSSSSATISSSNAKPSESETIIPGMVNVTAITSAPAATGSQVMTFDPATSSSSSFDEWSQSSSSAYSATSNIDEGYTPTQTWLIVASTLSSSYQATSTDTSQPTSQSGSGSSSTTASPSVATIPSSMPTLIVPGNSVANNAKAGTGSDDDPIKGDTLIAILLAAEQYPWWFVVESSDATSQLFNTFPTLISNALEIDSSVVSTYGLQVYQPASWNGDETSLLTQYMAYIPSECFDTLNAYIQTPSSPLYNQTGIEGQLAAQINTAFPLAAAASDTTPSSSSTSEGSSSSKKKRNIIIGVCVGVGGALWIALVWWVYKRTKRSNDKAVRKRLSEHMTMFQDHRPMSQAYRDSVTANNGWVNDRRVSRAPSIAASEIDDRPSSFYASPFETDRSLREQQRGYDDEAHRASHGSSSGPSTESPHSYGHSVFGGNWFQNTNSYSQNHDGYQSPTRSRMSQNPFEDMVTRSYLGTAGVNAPVPKRRSALGKPVNKALISQPKLQGNSLEFRDYGSRT